MDIGCIVLAGGRSSRMGADKAQMLVDGRRVIDLALESLPADWETVVVSSADLGMPTVFEEPPFGGPVAGIAAGLQVMENEYLAIMAVDAPSSGRMLEQLSQQIGANDVAVAVNGDRIQPLCAVWRRQSLAASIEQVGHRDIAARLLITTSKSVVRVAGDGTETDYDTPEELSTLGSVEFP